MNCLWRIPCFAEHLQAYLQAYFQDIPEEDFRAYQIDGTPTQEPAMHPTAIIATVAAGSVMTEGATADAWLRRSCHTPLRRGKRRYYDNCLYFFCLMLLSGCYQLESWA